MLYSCTALQIKPTNLFGRSTKSNRKHEKIKKTKDDKEEMDKEDRRMKKQSTDIRRMSRLVLK